MTVAVAEAVSPELYPIPIEPQKRRLESIDVLRGLLMVLMALDHTRDYFSYVAIDPVDPHRSWPALFITRWITHLCAPGFVALAGASVYLQRRRGKSPRELTRLLITRGLWLVFLEITVVSFGWVFSWAPEMQVIWAVGISMVGLGLIIRLPTAAIAGIGVAIVSLHNLLDPVSAASFGRFADVWRMLHEQGFLTFHGHRLAQLYYPALPWFGIICLGYAFGPLVLMPDATRRTRALLLSAACLIMFALLRSFDSYGDPFLFTHLSTHAQTAMSFMDVQKYPPSLHYVLGTFGVLLLLYTLLDLASQRDWLPRGRAVLQTFGRVPFFYYVPHIYLLHALAALGTFALHGDWHYWFTPEFQWGSTLAHGWGFSLPVIYAVWIFVVAVLYFPCKWFAGVKARRRDWWLSYL